jgi:hypothetical protein
MPPKILRRCTVCGNFHAAYLVPEHEGGKGYYCYNCWKARFGPKPESSPELDAERKDRPAPNPPHIDGRKGDS